jgi:dTMP kinase
MPESSTGAASGRFIVFEGGEASGKSTQAARLAARLGALLTREPGGTELGEQIRTLVLEKATDRLDHRAETLLMAAARAQHVSEVIRPALEAGRDVVCDRFVGSSLAYQGYGRGLPLEQVRAVSEFATGGLVPDLVLLLLVDAGEASRRRRGRMEPDRCADDRLDAEGEEFHGRVLAGYRALAAAEPDRWRTVDGTGTVDEVAARVAAAAEPALDH